MAIVILTFKTGRKQVLQVRNLEAARAEADYRLMHDSRLVSAVAKNPEASR